MFVCVRPARKHRAGHIQRGSSFGSWLIQNRPIQTEFELRAIPRVSYFDCFYHNFSGEQISKHNVFFVKEKDSDQEDNRRGTFVFPLLEEIAFIDNGWVFFPNRD